MLGISVIRLGSTHQQGTTSNQGHDCGLVRLRHKSELLDRRRFKTQAEARMAVFEFIEGFYNPRRRHSSLGYLSPVDYERRHEQAVDPGAHQPAAVLGAVKTRPGNVAASVDVGAAADLDRPCARRRTGRAGRDEGTGSAGAEPRNCAKQEDMMPSDQIP